MEVIVGTAGHIDHGKTALVKALTGIDADRLPEEKQRGITIDLGFAEHVIEDVRFGFVDVPGHERFVKNMLAGVSGIDLVLLVVAADEGVMPQTREHFQICRLLGIGSGLVVLTKRDLVDDESLELARMDVAELVRDSFLEHAPVIAVSAKTGEGIDSLNAALVTTARTIEKSDDIHAVRLPVDRSFTVKGFGTVVTGTLVSGEIKEADELEVYPGNRKVRVRGLQTHGQKTASVHRSQRVAVNLAGIDRDEIQRGMTLGEVGALRPTQAVDAKVEVLRDEKRSLRTRQRVRVHIGTKEALARVSVLNVSGEIDPGSSDFAQFRFETPVVALPGERFIIRAYSPQITIAGGCVLDNLAEKHRKKDLLQTREWLSRLESSSGDYSARTMLYVEASGQNGLNFAALQARTGLRADYLHELVASKLNEGLIIDAGGIFLSNTAFRDLAEKTTAAINGFHQRLPLSKGIAVESLREIVFRHSDPQIAKAVLSHLSQIGSVVAASETVRLATHRAELSLDEASASAKLASIYAAAAYQPPRLGEAMAETAPVSNLSSTTLRTIFQTLVDRGEIVKVTDEFYFSRNAIDSLVTRLRDHAVLTSDPLIDVAKFKEIAGVSRKYAIPLLEHFDRVGITRRAGDKRVILR